MEREIKYPTDIDTTHSSGVLIIERNNLRKDPNWLVKLDSSCTWVHLNHQFLKIDHIDLKMTNYASKEAFHKAFDASQASGLLSETYKNGLDFINSSRDSVKLSCRKGSYIKPNDSEIFSIEYPDQGDVKNMKSEVLINKKTKQVLQETFQVTMFNFWQYSSLKFTPMHSVVSLDSVVKSYISNHNYTIIYKRDSSITQESNIVNKKYIIHELPVTWMGGNVIDTFNTDGKLLLLDFWYRSCHPCLKAMPEIQKLYSKYQTKGLTVIGINPLDQVVTSDTMMESFLHKKDIDYPLAYVNHSVADSFSVSAYPTLFLIHNGIIISKHVGFSEKTFTTLEGNIQKYLKVDH